MNKQESAESIRQLDYDIADSKVRGEGSINSIKTQNGSWKSYIGADKTQLICKLKAVCLLTKIQIIIANANLIELSCFLNEQQKYYQTKICSSQERESNNTITIQSKSPQEQVNLISLQIDSYNKKQISIRFLRFYGIIIYKFQKVKQGLQVFNQRIKLPTKRKAQPKSNRQTKVKQKKQDRHQQMENQAASQSESPFSNDFSSSSHQEQLFMSDENEKKYKTIAIKESQLEALSEVSQKWLQQQRKLQINFHVKGEHKLSVLVCPKCLANQKICLANIYYQQKQKYAKMAKQLGAMVKEEPSKGCIVLTPNPKGSIIRLAKLMDDVAIVRLQYLEECFKHKMRLKTKRFQYTTLQLVDL